MNVLSHKITDFKIKKNILEQLIFKTTYLQIIYIFKYGTLKINKI